MSKIISGVGAKSIIIECPDGTSIKQYMAHGGTVVTEILDVNKRTGMMAEVTENDLCIVHIYNYNDEGMWVPKRMDNGEHRPGTYKRTINHLCQCN